MTSNSRGSFLELLKFSNLKTRVRFYGEPIVTVDWDDPLCTFYGAEVLLEHFVSFSVDEIAEGLQEKFDASEAIQTCYLTMRFIVERKVGELITFAFGRDRSVALQFEFYPGMPYRTVQARNIVESASVRAAASLTDISYGVRDDDGASGWYVEMSLNSHDVQVAAIFDCWQAIRRALCAYHGDTGPDPRVQILSDLHEGDFDKVIGQTENEWLDFKYEFDLGKERGKTALVKSVASFANADQSALLVVGIETTRIGGRDTAVRLAPVPADKNSRDRYQQVIDSYVFPKVRGLKIDHIEISDSSVIVVIDVPAQREVDKWFRALRPGSPRDQPEFDIWLRRGEGTLRLLEDD